MAIRLPAATRQAMGDALVDLFDGGAGAGKLEFRTGSQPASAGDAASGTLLATAVLADPAFGATSAAGAAAIAEVAPVNAVAAGTIGWARGMDSNNATVADFSVGMAGSGADIIVSNTNVAVGQPVDVVGGGVITIPAG